MRQPAYAKRLVEQRRAGVHPERIVVIYGNDWRVEEGVARLAVKPGEARALGWHAVAGLPITVIDRSREGEPALDENGVSDLYFMLGDIALLAASVHLTSALDGWRDEEVSAIAYAARVWDATARKFLWPAWWSDDIERIHGQNAERWLAEISSVLCA